uniref:Uncharacterized protein n=1 Tax=Palpitomonas bilix TaxID=652834 RepID=A0A7S3GFT2_9EUKA|mmetsp:Transcript_47509/g.123024  ORF Transcript_47509/g.123024 Transcript_47509/m.123024 type:complete len:611 (+) Transcript_47509:144-1976(+)|eukprot:CAMPEP_0113879812 /NCGR_PEP_ID=MMETSP0780_2-20120614/7440_1 /TAXON_ID=652834 /ORGANISM="Palpitomonas bilix" /LENGTH=610 /DNA_ID=CAMNT_0000866423 /DNA_START=144 /DNA_END=1976 /DNA_ORIENTATION=- /assembly_acc=CAM_ASM_000599
MSTGGEGIPFLPGATVRDYARRDFRKKQSFEFRNGVQLERAPDNLPELEEELSADEYYNFFKTLPPRPKPGSDPKPVPRYVALDRRVLRFYGYFVEPVHERREETYRVRKCIIYYYLEDDTIHVQEPKQENSGIPQGVFIKRHRIPKESGEFYTMDDLTIGIELSFYARTFKVIGCDPFTREYYLKEKSRELPENEPSFPEDPYQTQRDLLITRKAVVGPPKPKDDDLIRFMEAKLGLPAPRLAKDKLNQFLKNDRKVLRFYCLWDDRDNMFGQKRPYVLHYFLSDDTVEILEVNEPNSGRDPFPSFLKRQRLPKAKSELYETPESQYYTAIDFRVGDTLTVFGRNFYIFDADTTTIEYYAVNFGIDQSPVQLDEEEQQQNIRAEVPPYNGFGSEEDSLGSYMFLIPKVPKKNYEKIMSNDRKILRFRCKLDTTKPEDVDRRFILSYYLSDDTFSMFEPPISNSGISGGKFLERKRVEKPVGVRSPESRYYGVDDLKVGNKLTIFKYVFELLEADDFTRRYFGENILTTAQTAELQKRLRAQLKSYDPTTLFIEFDVDESDEIEFSEFKELLNRVGVTLTDAEFDALTKLWDVDKDGKISLKEFYLRMDD